MPRDELFVCATVPSSAARSVRAATGYDAAYANTARGYAATMDALAAGGGGALARVDMVMLDYPCRECDGIRGQWAALQASGRGSAGVDIPDGTYAICRPLRQWRPEMDRVGRDAAQSRSRRTPSNDRRDQPPPRALAPAQALAPPSTSLAVSNFSPAQLDCLLVGNPELQRRPVLNQLPLSVAYHPGRGGGAAATLAENRARGVRVQA